MPELKSPLLEKQVEAVETPPYKDEERNYLNALMRRIESAVSIREQEHTEFDGMTYTQNYERNRNLANTFIKPKKNPEDSNFQSGVGKDKLDGYLSSLYNLNLSPDVTAFDENNFKVGSLGEAMEDTILKTEELDGDEEKKMLRQRELISQGVVFVEEIWDERWMKDKKVTGGGKFTGQVKGLTWTEKLKRIFSRPTRNLVPGLSVFLGNIKQYDLNLQPYLFTVDVKDYLEAETMFGSWDRWKFVPKTFSAPTFIAGVGGTTSDAWKHISTENGQVVIIRYQDKWNNEFAVIINNVLMTPVGLPLTLVNGYPEYNLTQQNYDPLSPYFAYGGSLMKKLVTKAGLLDEMLKLGVLKSQQSYKPPLLNLSGRVLSQKIFAAGKITQGVDLANKLIPLLQGIPLGVTNAELAMVQQMRAEIDRPTFGPQFQGQQTASGTTATEVVELQRQARLMLGLTILACSLLEWKLAWLRIFNILANWFEPYDQKVEGARGELKMTNVFRRVSVPRPIEGEGLGTRMVIPTEGELPTSQQIFQAEEQFKQRTGTPIRFIFLKPQEIKNSKLTWQIVIRPREKTTSELAKLMFRAEMSDAMMFGQMLNMDYFAERFAHIWGEDPNKAFKRGTPVQPPVQPPEQSPITKIPGVPTPEQATGLNKQIPTR